MLRRKGWFGSLRYMGSYIGVSLVLFIAGIVAGTSTPGLDAYMNSQIEGIRQISETVNSSSNPTLMLLLVIFFNNAIKSVLVIYLGFFFGIFPVFFMVLNGMILGYLIHEHAVMYGGAEAFEVVVKAILPHGIIEIPVLIIAAAYGLKSGSFAFRLIGNLFARDPKLSHEAGQHVKSTVPIVIGVTVLLLAASLIESLVTPILMGK